MTVNQPLPQALPFRPRVLHVTSSENLSGGTRQLVLLARGQRDAGLEVAVCVPPGSPALARCREAGLETHPLGVGRGWGMWKASRTLRRIARLAEADVVHAHHTRGHNVALLATFGGGFPPVVANRGVLFRPKFPLKFRSPRTAAVVTNSLAVGGVLAKGGVRPGKIHVVYNACAVPDPEDVRARAVLARQELGVPEGAPVVGTVGSGAPVKGFRHLLEAVPEVARRFPAAVFVFVGASVDALKARAGMLGVTDRVRFTGHRDDAVSLMGGFDLFVFPSVGMDSCPNVVLEAMGVGLPVVGTDVGGVPEIVEDGRTGWVVPRGDPGRLAHAVCRALGDPARCRSLGRAGRERVAQEFSLVRKVEGTLDVYRSVLRRLRA